MNWLRRMLIGRYGVDNLSIALLAAWFVLHVILNLIPIRGISYLSIIVLILIYLRVFSKNIEKRQEENIRFMKWWNPKQKAIVTLLNQNKDKLHRYYKCPNCKKQLRVPRGKGKIRITCVHCKTQFIKRT